MNRLNGRHSCSVSLIILISVGIGEYSVYRYYIKKGKNGIVTTLSRIDCF